MSRTAEPRLTLGGLCGATTMGPVLFRRCFPAPAVAVRATCASNGASWRCCCRCCPAARPLPPATSVFTAAAGGQVTKVGNEYRYLFTQTDYDNCDYGANTTGTGDSAMGIYPDALAEQQNPAGVRSHHHIHQPVHRPQLPASRTTSTSSLKAVGLPQQILIASAIRLRLASAVRIRLNFITSLTAVI